MAQFPSKNIAELSYKFRTLGLGYANMGTYLMVNGIPYDSPEALAICGAITSIIHMTAYSTSAEMSKELGPFNGYEKPLNGSRGGGREGGGGGGLNKKIQLLGAVNKPPPPRVSQFILQRP